jgi:hypothetical protein
VRVEEEVVALEKLDGLIADGVIEQNRAKYRALRIDV